MNKIKEFIKKHHIAIISVLLGLLLIRGCQVKNKSSRIEKNKAEYENTIDSLVQVIKTRNATITENESDIRNLKATIDLYKMEIKDLKDDKYALRKVNSDNAKAIKNLSNND